jgi:hypothetical protein
LIWSSGLSVMTIQPLIWGEFAAMDSAMGSNVSSTQT